MTIPAFMVLKYLSPKIRDILRSLPSEVLSLVEEIRLRTGKPLHLITRGEDLFLNEKGEIVKPSFAYYLTSTDMEKTLYSMSRGSLYSMEEEMRQGFLTLEGGHRVGFVGKGVIRDGKLDKIISISSFNIRISHEIVGAAQEIIQYLIYPPDQVYNTLIISPPGAGKTTILRDTARLLSDGIHDYGFPGVKVGVVDERSELGGAYQGVPQNRIGIRTDLFDGVPKSQGMRLMIRSLSPAVLITDEIGAQEDIKALHETLSSGVKVITSLHASSLNEVRDHPSLSPLLGLFQRFLLLSRRYGPGTLEGIWDEKETLLWGGKND